MNLDIRVQPKNQYLLIDVLGEYQLNNLVDLISQIEELSIKHGCRRIVVDLTHMTGTVYHTDKHELAVCCAQIWHVNIKLAIVYREEEIDRVFESAALQRGVQVMIFPQVAEAISWVNESS